MMNPKVSVIIPNYNHAQYLEQRIESVLSQTYQDFEVIILDDCSPDEGASRAVIERYRDNPHVSHIIFNDRNSGSPFIQWNKGFELAKGEWIWIAESDDYSEPMFLETLVGQVDKLTSFVFCRSKRINQEGVSIVEHWQDELEGSFTMDGKLFISQYLIWKCIVWNASSVIFRKDFANRIPSYYMNFRAAGDWLFWICLSWLGKVSFVDTPLNNFRLHDNNTTQNSMRSGLAKEEKIKLYKILVSEGYITRKFYRAIRMMDLYNIYNNDSISRATINRLLDLWKITPIERFYLWLKKIYRRIKLVQLV